LNTEDVKYINRDNTTSAMLPTDLFRVPCSMMISKMQKLVDEIGLIEIVSNGTQLLVSRHVLSAKHAT